MMKLFASHAALASRIQAGFLLFYFLLVLNNNVNASKMSKSNQTIITRYLNSNGISSLSEQKQIIKAFDLLQPVYENYIYAGDRLFQYTRNTDSSHPYINTGRWFCLKGATMNSLAIFSGNAGRHLTEFKVTYAIKILEGTASKMAVNWDWDGGGVGGSTQIFIPENLLFAVEAMGTHLK